LKNLRGKVQFSLFCVDMFCDGGVLNGKSRERLVLPEFARFVARFFEH
jgi:hypothetical protein